MSVKNIINVLVYGFFSLFAVTCPAGQLELAATDGDKFPPAQIAASPANITLRIDQPQANGSIRLHNLGSEAVTAHSFVHNFELDQANRVQVLPPTAQSLDQWIIINPVDFTIAPGGQQVVRFSIRPRATPEPGEHRAMIFFEQVPDDNALSEGIKVNFRLGVAVYGLSGDPVRRGQLHGSSAAAKNDGIELEFDIESLGNALVRLDAQYSVWPQLAHPGEKNIQPYNLTKHAWDVPDAVVSAGRLPSTPVLPGTRRTIRLKLTPPATAGRYLVAIRGFLGQQALSLSLPFTVQ